MLEEFENVIHKYLYFLVTNQRDVFFSCKDDEWDSPATTSSKFRAKLSNIRWIGKAMVLITASINKSILCKISALSGDIAGCKIAKSADL